MQTLKEFLKLSDEDIKKTKIAICKTAGYGGPLCIDRWLKNKDISDACHNYPNGDRQNYKGRTYAVGLYQLENNSDLFLLVSYGKIKDYKEKQTSIDVEQNPEFKDYLGKVIIKAPNYNEPQKYCFTLQLILNKYKPIVVEILGHDYTRDDYDKLKKYECKNQSTMFDNLFYIKSTKGTSFLESHTHISIGFEELENLKVNTKIETLKSKYPNKDDTQIDNDIESIKEFLNGSNISNWVIYKPENKTNSDESIFLGQITSDFYSDFNIEFKDFIDSTIDSAGIKNFRFVHWQYKIEDTNLNKLLTEEENKNNGKTYYRCSDKINLKLKSLLNTLKDRLKYSIDINPDYYDGSFQMINEIARAYKEEDEVKEEDVNVVKKTWTIDDLSLVYFMTILNGSLTKEKKREFIEKSNLSPEHKEKLKNIFDKIQNKVDKALYHRENGEKEYVFSQQGKDNCFQI